MLKRRTSRGSESAKTIRYAYHHNCKPAKGKSTGHRWPFVRPVPTTRENKQPKTGSPTAENLPPRPLTQTTPSPVTLPRAIPNPIVIAPSPLVAPVPGRARVVLYEFRATFISEIFLSGRGKNRRPFQSDRPGPCGPHP
ncbi:hypothetical protein GWI33_003208 [Rhynchophorus ferrugineus]|uniref:Uncharacterized protein n=1 Tax=Rhynchophorus ferrugineus TaxID=354439 RepID=A0A834IZF7_RHYFE|nr:hypothetical protein GWI33_003208 [Rhynchophorus ferrugineus]